MLDGPRGYSCKDREAKKFVRECGRKLGSEWVEIALWGVQTLSGASLLGSKVIISGNLLLQNSKMIFRFLRKPDRERP